MADRSFPPSSPPASSPPASGDPHGLIRTILTGAAAPASPSQKPQELSPPETSDPEFSELIDLYFEADEARERDSLFERLIHLAHTRSDPQLGASFLEAMMDHDQDLWMRLAAAAELAKRGHGPAQDRLKEQLDNPEDPYFFEYTLETLVEVLGAALYDTLLALWRDPRRDQAEQLEAMRGLERVDPARAMHDFKAFVESLTDIKALAEDQVEAALLAFIRQGFQEAASALQALRQRIEAAPLDDPNETAALAYMIREGLDMLMLGAADPDEARGSCATD